jgi:hypothetical protein
MPLPAASDTMMVTGRLGYCAEAGDKPIDNSIKAVAAKYLKRRIAILPLIFVERLLPNSLPGV